MPIAPTDKWLKEDFDAPIKFFSRMDIPDQEKMSFYEYLQSHGMYRPSRITENIYTELVEKKAWNTFAKYEKKYQVKWNGPSVPIYIFPVQQNFGIFSKNISKSGVSFKDKIFFFISPEEDEKEWESVFVHEYHHCTRMKHLKKKKHYTLLDSIIFEGLAEYAVKEYCGEEYLSKWVHSYSDEQLEEFWKRLVIDELTLGQDNPRHDQILKGKGNYPQMLGYAIGYHLVNQYSKNSGEHTIQMLCRESSEFL